MMSAITAEAHFKTPNVQFTRTSTSHEFASVNEILKELKLVRVYGGMHFRFSSDEGATLGRRTGRRLAGSSERRVVCLQEGAIRSSICSRVSPRDSQ